MKITLSTKLKPTDVKPDHNIILKNDLSFDNPANYHSIYEQTNNLVKGRTENNFLNAFITAYNNHVPLKLRPDDIHIALQLVFCTCINNNAEKLRDVFVDFDGQKELVVNLLSFDSNLMMQLFTNEIKKNIKNPEFAEKFVAKYSTTTQIIETVSNSLLMNSTKEYFKFTYMMMCGIPEVILDGVPDDWTKLQEYYTYMKTLLRETELKNWFVHFDIIMNMFMDIVIVCQESQSVNVGLCCFNDKLPKYIVDKQKNISKLWERVISYVPRGSGGDTFLGGWVRLFFPYFSNKLIDGMDWKILPCLDINSEPKLESDYYGNQNILKNFYAGSTWTNISYSCTTTPLKIIDFYGLEYESEIFSGFFEHCVSTDNIVSMNIGLIVRKNISKMNDEI
jgi:hypothetical protein